MVSKKIFFALASVILIASMFSVAVAAQESQTDFSKFVDWIWDRLAHMTGMVVGVANEPTHIQSNVINVSFCQDLNQSDAIYLLTSDIITASPGTCFNVLADNVTLDCQGHSITGDSTGNGVDVNSRSGVTVKNCNLAYFTNSIYFENATYGMIVNNTASNNSQYGIYFGGSSGNTLVGNTANSNNDGGILLSYSSNNSLVNNTANSSIDYYGIKLDYSSDNSLIGNTAISNDDGGIYFSYSSDNNLINNTASSSGYGIYLTSSYSNIIADNTASSNQYGIYLTYSSNNNIINNTASSNTWGIILNPNADNNTITNNNVNNNVCGFALFSSSDNSLIDNTANSNSHGIYLASSLSNTIENNTASNNSQYGILLYLSSNNTISRNVANNNSYGINLGSSSNNTLTGNSASGNSDTGIYLTSSYSNIIADNTASSNSFAGIYLDSSSNNSLINNTVSSNNRGIFLGSSSINTLTNNTVGSNNWGIYLASSLSNTIYNNLLNNSNNINVDDNANNWNTTLDCGTTNLIGGNCTGGNFWAQPDGNGWSENATECNPNSNGICSSQYNITNDGNNIDYLPLTMLPSLANASPQIIDISVNGTINPVEGGARSVEVNFTVVDSNGFADLNASSARVNFTRAGEATRDNNSCLNVGSAGNEMNFTCTVDMWYFDGPGLWNVTAYVEDMSAAAAQNETRFTYAPLTAFEFAPTQASWTGLQFSQNDTLADSPITVNNTGNVDISGLNITAYDLIGENNSNYVFPANNFTVSNNSLSACGVPSLINNSEVNVPMPILAGNLSNGEAQAILSYCIPHVPSSGLVKQKYTTKFGGSWILKLVEMSVALALARKKKKLSKEQESLLSELSFIKSKYNINSQQLASIVQNEESELSVPLSIFKVEEMGPAESLVKHLKEIEGLKLSEIAKLLNRDARTIWVTYHNASGKKEKQVIEKDGQTVPLSIFSDRRLSILESIVNHLLEKGMTNYEIAGLIGKDQRNIGTLKVRLNKKLKKNSK